jgi:hypothetical protein
MFEILDWDLIKAKSEAQFAEDDRLFHAIEKAGCPEGCVFTWDSSRVE